MTTDQIVAEIDNQISALKKAKSLLGGTAMPAVRAFKPRNMSEEGRRRIAAGQKKRWAKVRAAA